MGGWCKTYSINRSILKQTGLMVLIIHHGANHFSTRGNVIRNNLLKIQDQNVAFTEWIAIAAPKRCNMDDLCKSVVFKWLDPSHPSLLRTFVSKVCEKTLKHLEDHLRQCWEKGGCLGEWLGSSVQGQVGRVGRWLVSEDIPLCL